MLRRERNARVDPGAVCLTTAVAVVCTVAVMFTAAHPLYAIFTNMFSASVFEAIVRLNPMFIARSRKNIQP
jgi:hypothetical protein